MNVEEYKEKLDHIVSLNDNIVECRAEIKGQKKFNKTMAIIYFIFLVAGIVGVVLKQYVPLWLYIVSWILVGLNAIAFIIELMPNSKYERELAGDVLGKDRKDKYDKDLNELSELINEDIVISFDDIDEKNNVVVDRLNVSERKYYYSKNDYIKYDSFETAEIKSLDLEEYE